MLTVGEIVSLVQVTNRRAAPFGKDLCLPHIRIKIPNSLKEPPPYVIRSLPSRSLRRGT
jgi:hypothetical protein